MYVVVHYMIAVSAAVRLGADPMLLYLMCLQRVEQ